MLNAFLGDFAIDTPLAIPTSENFNAPTWPPLDDFPIVVDAKGEVVTRFGDPVWNITPWAGRIMHLNFSDSVRPKDGLGLSSENSRLLKLIVTWWVFRPGKLRSANTISAQFWILRPLLGFISKLGISGSDLNRFPNVIEDLPKIVAPSQADRLITMLYEIYEHRAELGFFLLDSASLRVLSARLPKHEKSQTPYIPPRIWLYQVNRLRACLEDFANHAEQIEECFMFCLDAYIHNAGSLSCAVSEQLPVSERPFSARNNEFNTTKPGKIFHGNFNAILAKFGLDELIERWLNSTSTRGVTLLSNYFSLVSNAGIAYLLNFSLMRVDEATKLRADCLSIEIDPVTDENIYILQGTTTKTVRDSDARWITSPSVEIAVKSLSLISRLRTFVAKAIPTLPLTQEDINNPYLLLRVYEPWRAKSDGIAHPPATRPEMQSYSKFPSLYPKLFDTDELTINQADLDLALAITPTLDPERFSVGLVWPLGWHQLRRTGAVNMSASGLVGDSSVQYQLKHLTRAMSRYYAQGYYRLHLRLNENAKTEYLRTMYEMIAVEFSQLKSPRFISPHGPRRKDQILAPLTDNDHKKLIKLAEAGKIRYQSTVFGGCSNPLPCPHGGTDQITACGGGDGKPPCEHTLYDSAKLIRIKALEVLIEEQIEAAPDGTPLKASLLAQQTAVERIINVVEQYR